MVLDMIFVINTKHMVTICRIIMHLRFFALFPTVLVYMFLLIKIDRKFLEMKKVFAPTIIEALGGGSPFLVRIGLWLIEGLKTVISGMLCVMVMYFMMYIL